MYSILRIQYVHYSPDSVVQYTPKYSGTNPASSVLNISFKISNDVFYHFIW